MTKPSTKRLGTDTSGGAAVRRAMRQQSLKVPWRTFSADCAQMIMWRSFALWVRAIVTAERSVPDWLGKCIDQRCPGILDDRRKSPDYNLIWIEISDWVDGHQFDSARDGGWLDALHYYSGRDPRSELVWGHWTRVDSAWRQRRPKEYPSFEEWQQAALGNSAVAGDEATAPVNHYIEWEAFAFWVRLTAESARGIPQHLISVLNERCPGFAARSSGKTSKRSALSTQLWRDLIAWIEAHHFAPKPAASLDAVREAARSHLRAERIAAYWAYCSPLWKTKPPSPYPRFEEWLHAADDFVTN